MNTISFMTANFVARELNYRMTQGWSEGASATEKKFRPLETYQERFNAMLDEISAPDFSAIDLWNGHLDPSWATEQHIAIAQESLSSHGLSVSSLAFYISDVSALDKMAAIADALDCRLIGGGCVAPVLGEKRAEFVRGLDRHDLIFGYENHPEKSPAEVLEKIGDPADGRIGVALDTGWFGSQFYNAAQAIRELQDRLVHLHLKDIKDPSFARLHTGDNRVPGSSLTLKQMGHETCTLGNGVVPMQECLAAVKEIGYRGGLSIEHEPEDHSPLEDVRVGYQRVKSWLEQ